MHHNKSLKTSFINPDLGPNFNFLRIHLHIVVSQPSFVSSASAIRFIQFARKNSVDFPRSFFLQSLCWLVTSLYQFRPGNKILFTKNPNPQNNCLNFQRTWKNRALQYQQKKNNTNLTNGSFGRSKGTNRKTKNTSNWSHTV